MHISRESYGTIWNYMDGLFATMVTMVQKEAQLRFSRPHQLSAAPGALFGAPCKASRRLGACSEKPWRHRATGNPIKLYQTHLKNGEFD